MAGYTGTVSTRHSSAEVWHYLADLRSVAEWDPSIEDAALETSEPREVGARFEIKVSFLGRTVAIPYETVALDPPMGARFQAETPVVSISDEANITPLSSGGSKVTWTAQLQAKGVWRLADPLLQLAFRRLGARAEAGLAKRLRQPELSRRAAGAPA